MFMFDIDYFDFMIGRKVKLVLWFINKLFGYRIIIYSFDFVVGFCLVVFLSLNFSYWVWMFVLGYVFYLLLDSLIFNGIKFFIF